ncbi:MAG: hypothetical protein JW795_15305 [Chitinivibrionales bacterium]|nr:hypothetical protein [Chitinivibrionales bacterium]
MSPNQTTRVAFTHISILRLFIVVACIVHLFSTHSWSEEIAFNVPADHEKFAVLDSLRKEVAVSEEKAVKVEKTIIREKDKAIRNDYWTVKRQYCEFLIKNKLKTKKQILNYCYVMKDYLEKRMVFLKELQDISTEEERADYFQMWKRSQGDFAIVSSIIVDYEDSDVTPTIKHGRNANKVEDDE